MNNKSKRYTVYGITMSALILIVVGYAMGFRVGENFTLGRQGSLEIKTEKINTQIFIDATQKIVTTKENEVVSVPLDPKEHMIIVSRDGSFPWAKKLQVGNGQKISLSPILIASNSSGQIITQKDADYWKLRAELETTSVPTVESPLKSPDQKTKIWLENTLVVGEVNGEIKTILEQGQKIKNIDFYKDRSDALLVSIGDTIYMVETDTESTQNIVPVFKGQNPLFLKNNPNYIFVWDNNTLYAVVI